LAAGLAKLGEGCEGTAGVLPQHYRDGGIAPLTQRANSLRS